MDRNLILAFILSTAVIFGYYFFFPPAPPQKPATQVEQKVEGKAETVKEQSVSEQSVAVQKSREPVEVSANAAQRKAVQVSTNLYTAEIDTQNGVLTSLYLNKYNYATPPTTDYKALLVGLFSSSEGKKEEAYDPDRKVNMVGDVPANGEPLRFSPSAAVSNQVYHADQDSLNLNDKEGALELTTLLSSGLAVSKKITFHPDNYMMDVKVTVSNPTELAKEIQPKFFLGAGNEVVSQETQSMPKEAAGYTDESLETWDDDDFEKPLTLAGLEWLGVVDKYFVTAVKMPSADWNGKLRSQTGLLKGKEVKVPAASVEGKALLLNAGQSWTESFQVFMGPKEEPELINFDESLTNTLDFGWFSFIAHPLLILLRMLNDYVANWGVAIIILTIIVRLLMAPLALKGMMSMRKMASLGPKMKKLKEKYKNDKERMNKETMELYKKNGVNPMGGCLPMLLQIPIFIGLYQALLPAIELRHAAFALWMTDLSAPDPTLILPVLMGVSMFFQQKLTPSANMDPMQAKMMKYFPVIMMFFFLNFPTGLVLYWVVSNLISIGQQLIFNKIQIAEAVD